MRPYVIRQGDYLTKLALAMGFDADAVWSHPDNQALREKRPDRNILHPGDVLRVPEPEAASLPQVSPNTGNRYKARVPTVDIELALRDGSNQPLANKAYQVLGMGKPVQGTTDGDGLATFSVPVRLREVRVTLDGSQHSFRVLVGDMDPVDEPSGVWKRLRHLGFLAHDELAPESDEAVSEAVAAFQREAGLEPTGEVDQAMREALVRAHGS